MKPEEPVSRCEFEVALSFAGEDRAYVEMVARFLKAHGVSLSLERGVARSKSWFRRENCDLRRVRRLLIPKCFG